MLNKTKYKLYICFSIVTILFITTLFVFKPVIKMVELYTLFARVSPDTLNPVLDFGNANFMLSSVVPMMPSVEFANYPLIFDLGLCCGGVFLISLFLFIIPNIFISTCLSLIVMFCFVLGSIYMSRIYNVWIPVVWPILIQLFIFTIMLSARVYLKQSKLINSVKLFGYDINLFPNSIPFIKNVVQQPKKMDVTMACFKIKIPQFYQEEMYSNTLVYKINDCFRVIIDGCLKYDGLLDKTSNNVVYCYWLGKNHALKALKASMEINSILQKLDSEIKVSCGISSEKVMFAILGNHNFSNYTVLGNITEIVNKLENSCLFNNSSILVSKNTYNILKDKISFLHKGMISIYGMKSKIDFYSPQDFNINELSYLSNFIKRGQND